MINSVFKAEDHFFALDECSLMPQCAVCWKVLGHIRFGFYSLLQSTLFSAFYIFSGTYLHKTQNVLCNYVNKFTLFTLYEQSVRSPLTPCCSTIQYVLCTYGHLHYFTHWYTHTRTSILSLCISDNRWFDISDCKKKADSWCGCGRRHTEAPNLRVRALTAGCIKFTVQPVN